MDLVGIALPPLETMRGRWAAVAAVLTACGLGRGAFADPGRRWHYDDGGGNWCDLHLVGDGRAVLVGHDHEYSDTYFRSAAAYFGEPETDLLAGAPDWWAPPAEAAMGDGLWVGFVYGYDGGWSRARYEPDDGFTSLAPPFVDDTRCRELLVDHGEQASDGDRPVHPAAVDALVAADGLLTESMLRALVDAPDRDLAAGVAAAAAFRAR